MSGPEPFAIVDAEGDDVPADDAVDGNRHELAPTSTPAVEARVAHDALALSAPNIERARRAFVEFSEAEDGSAVGERLLHELVAGETAIAMELMDVEGALAVLLTKTVTDPRLATEVAKVFREATALSGAVRRRIEGSLNAAAGLKAQRVLLAVQRGRIGG